MTISIMLRSAAIRTVAVGCCRHTPRIAMGGARFIQPRTPVIGSHRHFCSSSTVEVKVPNMGESVSDGQLGPFSKKKGDHVEADEEVVQIETDKITHSVFAPRAGVITKVLYEEGDTVEEGSVIFEIDTSAAPAEKSQSSSQEEKSDTTQRQKEEKPAQKETKPEQKETKPEQKEKKPEQKEKKPEQKEASKPAESKKVESTQQKPSTSSKPASSSAVQSAASFSRETKRVPMSRMRQRIAHRLKDAQNTAAMLTTFNEIDMSAVIAMRKEYKDMFQEKHNVKLGFVSLFAKAAVAALRQQPAVNAFIDGNEIVYNDFVDISVAVATPTGLVVPVMRNCESMSIAQIEQTLGDLGSKARTGGLTVEDMTGGTFTISNGGVFGSLFGTPIINPPQSAILGMHATKERPVAVNGKVEIRPVMFVALTYDHRIIDGREAVLCLRAIKENLEDPKRLLLDL